ncbi:MAG: bifunctional DNA-formamidopyrimidine glycosylase/DNA-(apurinic or apyrimidinic site) lyase [Candidatus Magasanikbacteria bacterium]|nr:bifunctional DNA-formamidopyrimidine glycosylase/DNA-(apurinic or apyrimidinic site) lyase [Candidatus Magasanikbacteria bacterium]
MPELPEVTVVVNSLNEAIRGLVIESVEYDWKPKFYWNGFSIKDLKDARVKDVRRWGKVIIIDLSNGFSIVIHLKLTGQLIYQDKMIRVGGGHPIPPLNQPVPNSTTRATFAFTNEGHLYFNDMRKFGWVKIVKSDEQSIKDAIGKVELGPDPMTMTVQDFIARIKKKPQARIKKLLMDQAIVSGVGNIYSDEALWRAKIHPKRPVVSLTDEEIKAIFKGLVDSFNLAIEKGGSSANSFVDGRGEKGLYLSFANAYHMTGTPCKRCKTLIVREKMDSRSAHYCPKCQLILPLAKQGKLI